MLMTGDAAGMIAPLCGNGMAMAIHSAKILSEQVRKHIGKENFNRQQLETDYSREWDKFFARRLWIGRQIQNRLFGSVFTSNLAVNIAIHSKIIAKTLIKCTHGKPF
jgi:flavin-dependent dehydrogenase